MSSPAQPTELYAVSRPENGIQPRLHGLEEHQKTTISMFLENGINPKSIVKAAQHGGIENLLQEAERMVVVADTWQNFYNTDIKLLIQLYKKYGRSVLDVCLNELVQMSRQGLLQAKQDLENDATPTETPIIDDYEHAAPTGEKLDYPAKFAAKRLESTHVRTRTQRRASTMGTRPLPSSTGAKKAVSSPDSKSKRRVVAHICTPRCPKYMKRQAFINHALLKHKNKLPSETNYLDHQWDQHSEILSTEDGEAGVTPQEHSDTPCPSSSTPASEIDIGES
ncbi:uncharacterized protein N0V89_011549 [Didymosphaeria variabile]|uniref:Uncharacterized protein n=1 Tax=Didymosphaeria variabile TaxID=1932322 RepID=A0A9W8XA66_9PLEO|nr:uncharacterized protein N0V89_011549 [Didymosphaeria variabile]KAJ4345419.1 hypothetical protein N0V89_011549 [Didymosphaeria variabile]